jgi:predicted RNA-binding Zn-ribbon protein involved in translation (DUF1610 family)
MTDPNNCANCGDPLPPGQPAGNRYCKKCAASYWRGAATQNQPAPAEDGAAQTVPGECANCGAPLPPGEPSDNRYCENCAAAWRQGPAAPE